MEKEKTLILMLLDLCAFAFYQTKGESERRALEAACGLAERYAMPEGGVYRNLLARFDLETPGPSQPLRREEQSLGLQFPNTVM